jgi:WD40 repeat protein
MNQLEKKWHLAVVLVLTPASWTTAQTIPIPVIQSPVPADVGSATFSHDGKLVATMGELGRYTTVWETKTGRKVVTLSSGWAPIINPSGSIASIYPSGPRTLVFSPDDRYVAAVDNDSKGNPPVVWECETGQLMAWIPNPGSQPKLSVGQWTPADVQAWTSGSRGKVPSLLGGAERELRVASKIAVSADGSKLAVARGHAESTRVAKQADSIELWPLRGSQAPISFATGLSKVESLVFSHDAQWLGAATQSPGDTGKYTQILVGDVRLWHVSDDTETKLKIENARAAEDHEWSATNVAFAPDDKQVVATVFTPGELPERDCPPDMHCGDLESIPYEVRTNFFDITSGRAANSTPLGKSDSSESERRGFFWLSSDGRRAIAIQEKLTLVNTLTGREVGTFKPPELRPYAAALNECKVGLHAFGFVAFKHDGKQIAISDGQELQIVDSKTGASTTTSGIYIVNDASEGWSALAASFNPNGNSLGVAVCSGFSDDGELLLYNASNLQKAAGFRADSVLTSLAFTPDGSLLFAGGYDGAVRVIETQHGSLLATLFRSMSGEWIVFTPEGLYDASADGARLLVWRLKGQTVLSSELPEMHAPSLLSKLVAGERPKPVTRLALAVSAALTRNPR